MIHEEDWGRVILLEYVDDMILAGSCMYKLKNLANENY